jgi:phosphomannomutase
MIPLLLLAEFVSISGCSLSDLVRERFVAFPSSGEINFQVDDAAAAIEKVLEAYRKNAVEIDETDGVSLTLSGWRFNLRRSNTEPLVRLNIETKGRSESLNSKVCAITKLLGSPSV